MIKNLKKKFVNHNIIYTSLTPILFSLFNIKNCINILKKTQFVCYFLFKILNDLIHVVFCCLELKK